MMALRIAVNILLAVLLLVAAGALLMTDAYLVRDMVFEGAALWLLALSLGLWAAFAAVIAHGLGRGMLAPPPNSTFKWDPIYVDPTYQGLAGALWVFSGARHFMLSVGVCTRQLSAMT